MSETERAEEEVQSTIPIEEPATCPYLGLLDDPGTHALYPRVDHHCQLPGSSTPTPDSDWQERYCLSGRHDQCPLYRAVRHGQTASETPTATPSRWRRLRGALIVLVAALLVCSAVIARMQGAQNGSNQRQREETTHLSGLITLPTVAQTTATAPPIAVLAVSPTDVVIATTLPATPSPLPTSASPPVPTATPPQEPPTPAPALPTAAPSVRTYVVVFGDTLLDIAQRFGASEQQLIDINHIVDPSLIYAGEVLQIPSP